MESPFLVIFTFLFFQRFCLSITTTTSNVTCIQSERQSLLAFKQTITDRFNLLSTWSGVECCEWHGVGCDSRSGHVVKLDLRAPVYLKEMIILNKRRLEGSGFGVGIVPHHLGNLSRLQYLDLRNFFVQDNIYYHHESSPIYIFTSAPIVDDLNWVSSLTSLRHLDLSGITIGKHIDWFHPVNVLPSLLTLNLAFCEISIPSTKLINTTSLNSLDFSNNFIISTIPIWLSNLTSLMHLNLRQNSFHGKIPASLGMFSALASIDLSSNHFDSLMPNLLCNLSGLVHLDLSGNMLSGPIPASLGLLLRLEDLNLAYNQLSGNIPMSLGLLLMLEDLDLAYNQLSGNIPVSLGRLTKLKHLDLSYNSLVGVLSETHFVELKNLNYLYFSWNSLAFNFCSQWIAPFQLQFFFARSCNIGPNFPNWLKTQTNLLRLDLSNSSIRDAIPQWFENISSHILYLDLSSNQIYGKLPRFHFNNSNYTGNGVLKMNSNKFEGSLHTFPSNVRILDLSDNLLSGHIPQTDGTMNLSLEFVILSKNRFIGNLPIHLCKVPSIRILDLSDNLLSGDIPETYETMKTSLEAINLSKNRFTGSIPVYLCKVPSIQVLDLSHNKFSGRLPRCLGNLINLKVMDLANNTITGSVPSSLGSLTQLESLHLRNNKFKGNLPPSLCSLMSLVTMDIGNNLLIGSIPLWLGESLLKLRILNLQSNKFTGNIPLQLCQLNALQHLDLAQDNITGTIPRCFSNLSGMITNQVNLRYTLYFYEENIMASMKGTQLVYTKTIQFLTTLDLSSNNITGEIPDVLMNLKGLKNLNHSRNQLKGQVPRTIGNLSEMESLDLSMNMLSGRIPQSLSSLNFLSYLNLSYNNLSGAIIVGNQLQTLVDPSIYEGNDGLCGPPVSKTCKENGSSHNHVREDESHDDDDVDLWFYSGMGPGFVVGFLGLVGNVYFLRTWRSSYFKILEDVYGWLYVSALLNLAQLRRKLF